MDLVFLISDESVNCYGTRVLTAGIDLAGFKKNPVALYMHDRWKYLPIGHWEDLEVKDGKLFGRLVLDEADDFAKTIKGKLEAGTLRACSPGLDVVEWSEDPALLVKGQTRPTITKSALLEVSIVDIPGNKSAVKLGAPQLRTHGLTLSEGAAGLNLDFLPTLNQSPKMDKIALSLGLAATATQEEITAAILKLKQDSATEKVQLALKLAKESGRVSADTEAKFLKMASYDLDMALEHYGVPTSASEATTPAKPTTTLSAALTQVQRQNAQTPSGGPLTLTDKRKDWSIRDYEQKDPSGLLKLKREQPDAYQALYNDYYGSKL